MFPPNQELNPPPPPNGRSCMTARRLTGLVLALAIVVLGTTLFSGPGAPPAHAQDDSEITLWTGTLVPGSGTFEGTDATGYCAGSDCAPDPFGTLSPATFTHATVPYTVQRILVSATVGFLKFDPRLELNVVTPLDLYVDDTKYPLAYDRGTGNLHLTGIPALTAGQSYTVSIRTTTEPPPETNEITLWTATLTAAAGTHEGGATVGYCASNLCSPNPFGSLTAATFSHAGVQYGVRWILSGEDLFITGEPRLSDITLYLDSDSYPLTYNSGTQGYDVTGSIALTAGQTYTVSIRTTTTEPPPETSEITLWTATLVAAAGSHEGAATAGYCASNLCNPNPFGSLTTTTFTHAGTQYGVRWILSGEDLFITGEPRLSDITLYLDSDSYPLTYNSGTQGYDVTGTIALTAGQTYAVSIRTTTTEPPPPPETSEGTLWTATLVSGAGPLDAIDATGYCTGGRCNEGNFGSLNPATFTHKGVQYSISKLLVRASGSSLLTLSPRLDLVTPFSLYVGDTEYPATFGSGGEEYDLTGTPTLTSDQTYTVSIRIPPPVLPPGTLWSATLTAGAGTLEGVNATGYCVLAVQCNPPFGTLSPNSFDYEGTTYSVNLIANDELYITADLHEATPFSLFVDDTEYTATFTSPDADINYALSGNLSLTSGQTYTVSIRIATPETTPETTLWATTMTVGSGSGYTGYSGVAGSVLDDNFVFNGSTYRVVVLAYIGDRLELNLLKDGSRSSLGAGMFRLTLGSRSFEFDGSTDYNGSLRGYRFTGHGLSWINGQTVDVSLVDFTPARPGTLWRGSLTAGAGTYSSQAGVGYCGDLPVCAPRTFGALSEPTQFTYNAITYTVRALMSGGTGGAGGTLNLTGGNLQDQTLFVVYVGDAPYTISNRVGTRFNLGGGFPALTAGQTYEVSIVKLVDYDSDNDNLIEIANLAQLHAMRWDVDGNGFPDSHSHGLAFPLALPNMGCPTTCLGYELTADLDFDTDGNGRTDVPGDTYWNNGAGWGPIGTLTTGPSSPYIGKFHGNGHTISNLFINRATAQVGLFGVLGGTGFVHHVGLLNVNVTTTMHDVGPLVGFMQGNQTIVAASYVGSGSVTGANQTGGLVGSNQGRVRGVWTNVILNGVSHVGGVVGTNEGAVHSALAWGRITGTGSFVHGVVGSTHHQTDLASAGVYYDIEISVRSDPPYSRSTAELQGGDGYNNLYATWNVDVDGVAGNDNPWDFGTGREYPALKADRNNDGTFTWQEFGRQGRAATDSGRLQTTDYDTDDDNLIEVSTLAQLNVMRYDLDGDGTVQAYTKLAAETVQLTLAQAVAKYVAAFPNADIYGNNRMGCPGTCLGYELIEDLDFDTNDNNTGDAADAPGVYDANSSGWSPIHSTDSCYTATFEGNYHSISHLFINESDRIGLFGHLAAGEIRNVGLLDVNITASGADNGTLLAYNGACTSPVAGAGTITNSYATGTLNCGGGSKCGGLVGSNTGPVRTSWANVAVTNTGNNNGGLVGHNTGSITASYAIGPNTASGSGNGGLDGSGAGSVTNSYFNNQTTALFHRIQGKTTAELQNPTGYTGIYANWNLDLNGDGTADDPWHFGTSSQYPAHKGVFLAATTITITADSPSVDEGQNAVFTVAAAPMPESDLTVNLAQFVRNNCATLVCDAAATKTATTPSVIITGGQTSVKHSVPTENDAADEYDGSVTLTTAEGASPATVTVMDDDAPPSFQFQEEDGRATESFGRIPVNVEMTPAVQYKSGVSVNWAITADAPPYEVVRATEGVDFTTSSGTLAFPPHVPGQDALRYRSFNFPIVDDGIDEADEEDVYIALSIPPGVDATLGNKVRMLLRITDSDSAQPQLAPTVAAEGSGALRATWLVPPNTAANAFTGYNVQYRLAAGVVDVDTPAWTDGPRDVLVLTAVIDGLDAGTEYQARVAPVRVKSAVRTWSAIGAGTTGALPPGVPGAPGAPTFTDPATDGWTAAWTASVFSGDSPITGYDMRYRLAGSGVLFTNGPQGLTTRSATITGLLANTAYEVQARAVNTQGGGAWSASGYAATTVDGATFSGLMIVGTQISGGITSRGYRVISYGSLTPDSLNVGGADRFLEQLFDTEPNNELRVRFNIVNFDNVLPGSYNLRLDNASFLLNSASYGTDSSEPTYYVIPTANLSWTEGQAVAVSLVPIPDAPAAPTFGTPTANSLVVNWAEPANTGGSAITSYDLQYRVAGSGAAFTPGPQDRTGTTATIGGLTANTAYEAQARATNATGGSSLWSASGYAATTVDGAIFSGLMTVAESLNKFGYNSPEGLGALEPASFTANGNSYTIVDASYFSNTFSFATTSGASGAPAFILHLDGSQIHLLAANKVGDKISLNIANAGQSWVDGQKVAVSLVLAPVPVVTITAGPAVTEGAEAVFTVTADPAPPAALTVILNVTATGDYGVTTGLDLATIPANQQSVTHTVATTSDNVFEPSGSVTATVTAGNGYTIGDPASAEVTVNDGLSFSIDDVTMNEGDSGMTPFVFTVTASHPVVTTRTFVPVDYQVGVRPLTATEGVDYVLAASDTLEFYPGDTSKQLTIQVIGDTVSERDETFVVGISSLQTAPIAKGEGIGTIVNDDRTLGVMDYDVDDDNLIEVSSLAQLNAIRWDLTGAGAPADANSDAYFITAFPGALLNMGCAATCVGYELTANLDFDTNNDGVTNVAGDTYWNNGLGWDPIAGKSTAQWYQGVFHGNGHTISNLYIRRQFSDDGQYFAGLFGEATGRISYVALLDVNITGWNWVGALAGAMRNEDAVVVASYATGRVSSFIGDSEGVGGLVGAMGGKIIASYADVNMSGPENFIGGLVGNLSGFVSNPAQIAASLALGDVTAGGDADDTAVGGVAGRVADTNAGIDDTYFDTENTVSVLSHSRVLTDLAARGKTTSELQTPAGYTGIYANWNVDVDNADGDDDLTTGVDDPWDFGEADEYPALKADSDGDGAFTWEEFGDQGRVDHSAVSITADQTAVTEGQTARFTVSINPADTQAVTVNLLVTAHLDYGVASGPATVVIPANAPSAIYTVTTTNDDVDQDAGSVTVEVRPGRGYDALTSSATVTINDNDTRGVSIPASGTGLTVAENAGTAQYTVRLNSEPTASVTITPSVTGPATFSPASLSFTTGNWAAAQTVTVTGVDDSVDNPGNRRTATITHAVSGGDYSANSVTAAAVTVTVIDDEGPVPAVSITANRTSVTEGQSIVFTITGDEAPDGPVTVSLRVVVADDNGGGGTTTETATIPANGRTATLTVTTVNDELDETGSSVTVTVVAGAGYTVGSPATVVVTVNDNDLSAVSIEALNSRIIVGSAADFRLTATTDQEQALRVRVRVTSAGVSGVSRNRTVTVTIPQGQATAVHSIAIRENSPPGTVIATLLTNTRYVLGSPSAATVTVRDRPPGPVARPSFEAGEVVTTRKVSRPGEIALHVDSSEADTPEEKGSLRYEWAQVSGPAFLQASIYRDGNFIDGAQRFLGGELYYPVTQSGDVVIYRVSGCDTTRTVTVPAGTSLRDRLTDPFTTQANEVVYEVVKPDNLKSTPQFRLNNQGSAFHWWRFVHDKDDDGEWIAVAVSGGFYSTSILNPARSAG